MFTTDYDNSNPTSILNHAQQIQGCSLAKFLKSTGIVHDIEIGNNKSNKGGIGRLVEELFFGYKPNSNPAADFETAGVELKVTPLKRLKNGTITTKERLVLSMIDYQKVALETWDTNSLVQKIRHLLLMFYLHEDKKNCLEYIFELVALWQPSAADWAVIKKDWNTIRDKIRAGRAHELSEGDTAFLGACTKSSDATKRRQQYGTNIQAKPRAFSFKSSYIRAIYEELSGKKTTAISRTENFEDIVLKKFNNLAGKSISQIATDLEIKRARGAKQFISLFMKDLELQLFGGPLDKMSEFIKSGIEIKSILLKPNGVPKESMSFEQIVYSEIANQDWETSEIHEKFENKKHLWLVFRATRTYTSQRDLSLDEIIFERAIFWNMPIDDLENGIKPLWQDTVKKIRDGDYNNFLRSSQNSVGHIRPKATNAKDTTDKTPQGTYEKKRCFWLNASYVAKQIKLAS